MLKGKLVNGMGTCKAKEDVMLEIISDLVRATRQRRSIRNGHFQHGEQDILVFIIHIRVLTVASPSTHLFNPSHSTLFQQQTIIFCLSRVVGLDQRPSNMGISELSDLDSRGFVLCLVLSIITIKDILCRALENMGVIMGDDDSTPQELGLGTGFAQLLALGRAKSANPSMIFSRGSIMGAVTECAICMSHLEPGQAVISLTACSHVFHEQCIDKWMNYTHSAACPLCRSPLVSRTLPEEEHHLSRELMLWFCS